MNHIFFNHVLFLINKFYLSFKFVIFSFLLKFSSNNTYWTFCSDSKKFLSRFRYQLFFCSAFHFQIFNYYFCWMLSDYFLLLSVHTLGFIIFILLWNILIIIAKKSIICKIKWRNLYIHIIHLSNLIIVIKRVILLNKFIILQWFNILLLFTFKFLKLHILYSILFIFNRHFLNSMSYNFTKYIS